MPRKCPFLIVLSLALAAAGCGKDGEAIPIEEKRVLAQPRPEQTVAADTRKRLAPQADPRGGGTGAPAAPALAWDLPEGWKEIAPTQMRAANFTFPAAPGLECYVTVLPGGGGGLAANMNRWRKQMGLGPLSEEELAALPRVRLLGSAAPFLQMDGTFTGGSVEGGSPGYTMAAVALDRPNSAVFVKMVGPSAAVRAEIDRFKVFCSSLREAAAEPPPGGDGDIKWTAPEGWTQGPAKQMRLVTFVPQGTAGVECYVTVLSGTGGGLESNVNRWRDQLKLAPLSAADIAALPTLPVLGRSARLVEIYGAESGLLGLVCELGPQTVFVKMTGPTASLRAERERFVAFCRSLSR